MQQYSEQDLKHAAEFREGVHREALAIVRKTRPDVHEVLDRHPVEDYFQEHWDYPGKWYTIVSIPYGCDSRKALVDTIVRDTLSACAPAADAPVRPPAKRSAKPDGFRELFTAEVDLEKRSSKAVGTDAEGRYILEHYEEYSHGGAVESVGTYDVLTDTAFRRYARLAQINGFLTQEQYDRLTASPRETEDPFSALIAEYPDLAVDYRIVKPDAPYSGYASHRAALTAAWRSLFASDEGDADGKAWQGNPDLASGARIPADALFSSDYKDGTLNYRKAFLYPPHGNDYTGTDFVRVNAALFPNGTDALEVYKWSADWSEYLSAGQKRWGALCLTVYDRSLDRFAVIFASAAE